MRAISLSLLLAVGGATASAETTLTLPLSGMGEANEKPVYWDFRLDAGRGSGAWKKIVVPSQWEQQGFGAYYYGTQGRGKPDDDPVIPKETGTYKRSFDVPASWKGRAIYIVFEAAMTDTTVLVNGKSAGPTHQGGFYRFDYDITSLIKPGRNEIEVRVAKESSNTSVNHAERRGDYWTFGGIYRPVWLEARPETHITWTAIDARADGSFSLRAMLNRAPPAGTSLVVRLFDAAGKPLEPLIASAPISADNVRVTGKFEKPATWTAETPHLYRAHVSLISAGKPLHALEQRFGFRTIEVRPNDGVYLNGTKIVLKGINRHSFRAATGRTLTRAENYADARLIKDANMNAVRMSHYPPDASFLDAADELGLYVLDELAGWQGFYDTPTGARLIGQIVRRDVNHPSILFWDNGNEGGWNRENDGEFHRWDPQRRPVLHPWGIHSGINTDHYEGYDSTVRLSAGPEIFMPTEFLHGLYDGGIGAGFRDYWNVMGRSPTVAGGFFWAFADEGIERTDRDRAIDNMGNAAPDGIVGARHEKEGSFFAVKEIWSPVQITNLAFSPGKLSMRIENAYDFTDLSKTSLRWRALKLPAPGASGKAAVMAQGRVAAPALAARTARDFELPVTVESLGGNEMIEIEAVDAGGNSLWSWSVAGVTSVAKTPSGVTAAGRPSRAADNIVDTGRELLRFDSASGELVEMRSGDRVLPIHGPRLTAWLRHPDTRGFSPAGGAPALRSFELVPPGEPDVIARARYEGALREVTWSRRGNDVVVNYRIELPGDVDIAGIRFDFPEDQITGKRWVGAGPYRVWKNRQEGVKFGLHETPYSRSTPGVSYEYPEFEGFFGAWRWLEMRTRAGRVVIRNGSNVPWFGLYRPQPGEKPVIDLPDVGWSFLHAIPSIGTKFDRAEVLGPQSQPSRLPAVVQGEIVLTFPR
jgi:hypothetical protein